MPQEKEANAAQDNEQKSQEFGRSIAQLLPDVVEQSAGSVPLDIDLLREQSCLRPELEKPQTQTAWIGHASGDVEEPGEANASLDSIRDYLIGHGWEQKNETTAEIGDVRTLYFRNGELGATAAYDRTDHYGEVSVSLSTPCLEHPEEHQMVRSELDPDFGLSSQYYTDDDGV